MGKAGRLRAQRRALAAERHVKVMDAAEVVSMAERIASLPERRPALDPGRRQAAAVAQCILREWRKTQVVIRADREFAGALLDSDTDVPLVPDWLSRMPFDTFACSLANPMRLDDGSDVCYYRGFLAAGIRSKEAGAVGGGQESMSRAWTTYGPLSAADGIRFLWLFNYEMDPRAQAQTVTVPLKGVFHSEGLTLAGLIALQKRMTAEYGLKWGQELDVLVPLSLQLALYMAAQEPDLDWIPEGQRSRHKELGPTAKVANAGWRIGVALRTWRKEAGSATSSAGAGPSGWRLPPHIRRAHWHRVRVATRDEAGAITGNRSGQQGPDWHYEMRWFPPTPVNVTDQSPLAPAVRGVETG